MDIKELATLTAADMDDIYLRNVPAIVLEQYCTRFLAAYLAEQVAALRVDAERLSKPRACNSDNRRSPRRNQTVEGAG